MTMNSALQLSYQIRGHSIVSLISDLVGSLWEDVIGGSSDWGGKEAVLHHETIVIIPEETPDSDIGASKKLTSLHEEDKEVPEDTHEEFLLNGFTDNTHVEVS